MLLGTCTGALWAQFLHRCAVGFRVAPCMSSLAYTEVTEYGQHTMLPQHNQHKPDPFDVGLGHPSVTGDGEPQVCLAEARWHHVEQYFWVVRKPSVGPEARS